MDKLKSKNTVYVNPTFSDSDFINDTILYADKYKERKYDKTITIEPIKAFQYQGNLFGLFKELGIPSEYHMLLMYYNDYTSPHEYDGKEVIFIQPQKNIFNEMYQLH